MSEQNCVAVQLRRGGYVVCVFLKGMENEIDYSARFFCIISRKRLPLCLASWSYLLSTPLRRSRSC